MFLRSSSKTTFDKFRLDPKVRDTIPSGCSSIWYGEVGPELLVTGVNLYTGYLSSGSFPEFSLMLKQGSGGAPKYGTVAQLHLVGTNPLSNITVGIALPDEGSPYWDVSVQVPAGTENTILIDVLPSFRGQGLSQGYVSGHFTTKPDGHYEAQILQRYTFYSKCIFRNFCEGKRETAIRFGQINLISDYVGGLHTFNTSSISWLSVEKNTEILSKITTTPTNTTNLNLFYSSLYFMNLLPTNQTGEDPGWKSAGPYYQDIFTLWGTCRCSTALMHVISPVAYEEYLRAMIDMLRFDGYMPDGRSSNHKGRTQGGTNADNV
ncbi:uncharacterized protein RAG0_14081 [Rhynchosporium agropyri]|uniref:Glycosyl hydrolase family 92 domain-containing protein n=1 Tax=Rhynchosporium agropyri TaxID=914238 RepID=A0A1E1LFU2_9HELO|nr:uncharacterized protein RAG0_14081 [Rhynchosporium agropyri]